MRNHSKKMLSFLLAILLLLGTMPMAINAFAADNKPTLILNGGSFVNSSTQVNAGGACYFVDLLKNNVSSTTKIYFVLNGYIKDANPTLYQGYKSICAKYNIGIIECDNIEKVDGHPTAAGMESISNDVINYLKNRA